MELVSDKTYSLNAVIKVFIASPFSEASIKFDTSAECESYVNKFKYYFRTNPQIKNVWVRKRGLCACLVKEPRV